MLVSDIIHNHDSLRVESSKCLCNGSLGKRQLIVTVSSGSCSCIMSISIMADIVPPFTADSAQKKVKAAQAAWNSKSVHVRCPASGNA